MENTVFIQKYPPEDPRIASVNVRELLRYAGHRAEAEDELRELLSSVIEEALPALTYQVCYRRMPLAELPALQASKGLTRSLRGSREVVLFGATVGLELDRLIARYQRISPARALLFHALGAERIECLCDAFCGEFPGATTRFSPGYGDFPLSAQRDLFALLDCSRKIGLTLNESLIMSPSKSVTAIFGVDPCEAAAPAGCAACTKQDCSFKIQG